MNSILVYIISTLFLLMPLVDNINGFLQVKYDLSIIGPVYRVAFIILISLIFIINEKIDIKKRIMYILIIISFFILHSVYVILGYSQLIDIRDLLKVFYPLFLFFILNNIELNRTLVDRLRKSLLMSINIYSIFIIISFLIKFKMHEQKEGYYGSVYDLNGLMLIYIIMLPLLIKKEKRYILFNLFSYLLTASKSIIIFLVGFIYGYYKNKQNVIKSRLKSIITLIILIIVVFILIFNNPAIRNFIENHSYFLTWDWTDMLRNHMDIVLDNLTYGRANFVSSFLTNVQKKGVFEVVFGSGIKETITYINYEGRYLMEMDAFDAFNINGILGLYMYFYMYFYQLKFVNNVSKKLLAISLIYSLIGGHLYIGAIANLYYVVVLTICKYDNFSTDRWHDK